MPELVSHEIAAARVPLLEPAVCLLRTKNLDDVLVAVVLDVALGVRELDHAVAERDRLAGGRLNLDVIKAFEQPECVDGFVRLEVQLAANDGGHSLEIAVAAGLVGADTGERPRHCRQSLSEGSFGC